MSRRISGVDVAGLVLGIVAIGSTVFAAVSIFGRGPLAMQWPGRPGDVVESIAGGLGRGLQEGARAARPWGVLTGAWKSAEGEQSVSGSQTALTVTNVSGRIRVSAWDGDFVRVRWVKQARTEADLENFVIEVRGDADSVTVRPVYERTLNMGRFGPVEFDVSLPARVTRVSLSNISGSIEVGLPGVVAKDLKTVSGSITSSGDGELTVKSTSGAVDFDFSGGALKISTVSGKIEGSIGSLGSGGADIHSVSGRVDLEAFAALEASLDLRSVSGSVSCDFPVTIREQSRGRLQATVGSGTVPFSVSTTSGSIRLGKR